MRTQTITLIEPVFKLMVCTIEPTGVWIEDPNNAGILRNPFGGNKYFLHHSSFKDIKWDPTYKLGNIGDNYHHIIYTYTEPYAEVVLIGGAEAEFLQRCIVAQTALFSPELNLNT